MNRFLSIALVLMFSIGVAQVYAQPFDDCQPIYYFDKTAPRYTYTTFIPSQTFAVKMSPTRAGRLDSAIIGFGVTKAPTTKTIPDTIIIRILEDMLPAQIDIGSYVFAIPPDLNGNIPSINWIMELNFFTGEGPRIKPMRNFWISWRLSGPSADRANILLRKASPASGRSVVISGVGATTPITTVAWSQVADTVDLEVEARICYEPIPVELSSFHAVYADGKTWLEWTTASETHNFGFDVERLDARSDDGAFSMWRKMGFVPGNGTTTMENNYSFIDENPSPAMLSDGTVRYRLRQIDYDGTEDVSHIQSVLIAGPANSASLSPTYPNPVSAQSMMTVPFSVAEDQTARIEVRDILGNVVAIAFDGLVRRGHHSVTFPTADLTPGWYTCTLLTDGSTDSRRFMVVR